VPVKKLAPFLSVPGSNRVGAPHPPGLAGLSQSFLWSFYGTISYFFRSNQCQRHRGQSPGAFSMSTRDLLSEFRFSLRILRRNPGFSAAAIVVLALGIGANTAIFSVVNAVLLRPLPFDDSSRIMQVWHTPPAQSFPGLTWFSVSPANYLDWRSQSSSFEQMAAYGFRSFTVGGKERPEAIQAAAVASDFFPLLRVQPLLGRTFAPD